MKEGIYNSLYSFKSLGNLGLGPDFASRLVQIVEACQKALWVIIKQEKTAHDLGENATLLNASIISPSLGIHQCQKNAV